MDIRRIILGAGALLLQLNTADGAALQLPGDISVAGFCASQMSNTHRFHKSSVDGKRTIRTMDYRHQEQHF
jgi:hypothetical protein